jgi:hypothetical protein
MRSVSTCKRMRLRCKGCWFYLARFVGGRFEVSPGPAAYFADDPHRIIPTIHDPRFTIHESRLTTHGLYRTVTCGKDVLGSVMVTG